jgi:hypothetical protein
MPPAPHRYQVFRSTRLRGCAALLSLAVAACGGSSDASQPSADAHGPPPPPSETAVIALENDYVRVARNSVACPTPAPTCAERVIVALDTVRVTKVGGQQTTLARGDFVVFAPTDSYEVPTGGRYYEVAFKPEWPPVESPAEMIPPDKNVIRYDGERFFLFEERLDVGDTRERHSHSQRVVMQLNATSLEQKPDGEAMLVKQILPDSVAFNPPVIHTAKNIGTLPLRGIVIELKPEGRPGYPMKP